ncbi:MAG: VOC family protein [Candidatus Moraniibacteriota bacterium]
MEFGEAAGFMEGRATSFWIVGEKKMVPSHIAFVAKDRAAVQKFYKLAIASGGKDNGKPGYRKDYWPGYYAAFVLDTDGNNIEAVWYDYSKAKKPAKKAAKKAPAKKTSKKAAKKK